MSCDRLFDAVNTSMAQQRVTSIEPVAHVPQLCTLEGSHIGQDKNRIVELTNVCKVINKTSNISSR